MRAIRFVIPWFLAHIAKRFIARSSTANKIAPHRTLDSPRTIRTQLRILHDPQEIRVVPIQHFIEFRILFTTRRIMRKLIAFKAEHRPTQTFH